MLPRVLEPEVMDTVAEAVDYDAMDHSAVNRAFVEDFLHAMTEPPLGIPVSAADGPVQILDVGTGTALIPIELCRRSFACQVVAVDLAEEMLKLARRNVQQAALQAAIELERQDAKALTYADGRFDAVMSNSIVHHSPQPRMVLAEMLRVLRPGGLLFVRDLMRPSDQATLDHLVETYAGNENGHQQQMFRDSLHAALTVGEVGALLGDLGVDSAWVRATSDRHWTIVGRRGTE
jgi:ubiquinone/menaquinone biosynthesis C-methylase UbiE